MSIWASVPGEPIKALVNDTDDANYRAEGEPTAEVDVATARSWHDHIRLTIWGDGEDTEVLLSPDAARQVGWRLLAAAGEL
jgi:hypothetical protein